MSHDAQSRPQARPEGRLAALEEEVAGLRKDREVLWEAVTALSERVAEATQAEEIIRRAHAQPELKG